MRQAGDNAGALTAARALARAVRSEPAAQPHEVSDADRLVATLERVAALPRDDQAALAEADRLTPGIHEAYATGAFERMVDAVRRQHDIRRRLLGEDHPETADSLNDLGLVYQDLGRLDDAEAPTLAAYETLRRVLGAEHPDVANTANSMARLAWLRGDMERAGQYLREAVRLWRQTFGVHEHVALGLHNLGRLYHDQAAFAEAEPLYREALAMRRRVFGADSEPAVFTLAHVGRLLSDQGEFEAGVALLREATGVAETFGPEHEASASFVRHTLGSVLRLAGQHEESERIQREVVEAGRSRFGDEHPEVATLQLEHGNLLFELERTDEAYAAVTEALRVREHTLGVDHPESAFCFGALGRIARARGDVAEAERLFQLAVDRLANVAWRTHPFTITTLIHAADLAWARQDTARAEALLVDAAERFEHVRRRVRRGTRRATFASLPYPRLAGVRLARGDAASAWETAEQACGRVAADLLSISRERSMTDAERARLQALDRERDALEGRLAALDVGGTERDVAEDVRSRLLEVEARLGEMQHAIDQRVGAIEEFGTALTRVQDALSSDVAVVSWLRVPRLGQPDDVWGAVVRDTGDARWVALPPEARETAVALRDVLASSAESLMAPALSDIEPAARAAWASHVDPLLPELDGVRTLITVASGDMAGVPVDAARDPAGSWLGDRFGVVHTPSAAIAAWLVRQGARDRRGRALLIGDPTLHAHTRRNTEADVRRRHASLAALHSLPPLSGSRREIEAVQRYFEDPVVRLGDDASEAEVARLAREGQLASFDVIHVATHAIVNETRPELSALVLSQRNLPDPVSTALAGERVQRGLVTAGDIARDWSLDADLVTLSACNTGMGRRVPGEGLVGFVHTFLQVGARSVLVSLWAVDDDATSRLMARFYEKRFGPARMSKADALRDAKQHLRTFRDEAGDHPYAHPMYWAAFALFGAAD